MHRFARWLAVGVLLSLTASGLHAQDAKTDLATKAREVFKTHCYRCHHGPMSEGGEFDVLKFETLTAVAAGEKPSLVAGKPGESDLWQRMGVKGNMPPKDIRERPTDAEKAAVKAWIEAGAPAFPAVVGRPFLETIAVLTAIRDDLRAADALDRPYLRYFTLAHLHNNPLVPDADLRSYRAALSKMVNSLSWRQAIVLPRALPNTHDTVFAVDVRKLDWDRNDLWRAVMRQYPYALRYASHPNQNLQRLDDDLEKLTGCELPVVRADWFIATAARPPLYHALLELPTDAKELEEKLGVDVKQNFLRDELARGAFAQSGVSGQNRMVERHDATYGAYWKSYDFLPNRGRGALPQFPLGPNFKENPHNAQAFDHDGGEIIFNLPNGLQAYLLIDGKDARIDVGPIQVVADALKTSGTAEIVNGVSCMACHKHGMIPFADQVREGTAVSGDARRKVQRLYLEKKAMDEKVKEDSERFLKAMAKATGPFLKVGDDAKKDLREFPEPVGEIARLYRLRDLDLVTAACELGIAKPEDLKAMIAGNKKLREYGLAPLLQAGGAVKRAEWERVGATSLMQRVARELELGTPVTFK